MNTYKIVTAFSLEKLSTEVNHLIVHGWKPEGGITYRLGLWSRKYIQVLIRK